MVAVVRADHKRQKVLNIQYDGPINDRPSIGWIGTGVMGAPMAGHLLDAGYELTVFNRTRPEPMIWWRAARGAPPVRPRPLTAPTSW